MNIIDTRVLNAAIFKSREMDAGTHVGVVLVKDGDGFVTREFYIEDNLGTMNQFWGHYYGSPDDQIAALEDFKSRAWKYSSTGYEQVEKFNS